ncbi:MAG: hypothetical protein V4850_22305 [Myxococcota bacterium]
MTPTRTPLDEASRPLVLLDGMPYGMALEGWIHGLLSADPRRGPALVRLAELLRPIDPIRALEVVAEAEAAGADPQRVAAVTCAAYLETNQPDAAEPFLVGLPYGPARDLLEARYALLKNRVAEGRTTLDLLIETPGVPAEILAEALSFRARARPEAGVEGSLADLERLETLCIAQRWTLTGIWLGVVKGVVRSQGWAKLGQLATSFDLVTLLDETLRGVDLPATLGPVPPWVHAAAVKHRAAPQKLVETLVLLGALLWKIGREDDAYRTVTLGAGIARRLAGPRAGDDLDAFLAVLRKHAGESKWAELHARLMGETGGT